LLQPLNSGNRNDCSQKSCFESYTYILELWMLVCLFD
jgi:hypothetical protein